MKHLTVRQVPPDLAEALEREKRRRGTSLNRTVLDLLRQLLGVGTEEPRNGLEQLSGTWSEEELEAFDAATTQFDQIDQELWG
jgi:hypothetical protein